jgi:hypothetical protein
MNKEKELATRADELALQSKQFADYLAEKKHADEELEILWKMVKEYMIENNYAEYDGEHIKLSLSPSGKYKAEDIDKVDDALCDIKKTINNRKVKSYIELNGHLPDGVESTGYVLRKTLKEG